MFNTRFDYLICEYMVYCRSRQLRPKTMNSYEQGLRLFERWCQEQMGVDEANKITENMIRRESFSKKEAAFCVTIGKNEIIYK